MAICAICSSSVPPPLEVGRQLVGVLVEPVVERLPEVVELHRPILSTPSAPAQSPSCLSRPPRPRSRFPRMTEPDVQRPRVVAISGAGTGIGQATARKFAEQGWQVVVGGRRVDRLSETASLVEASGGACLAHELDVTDAESVERFFAAAEEGFGTVTAVINNAATRGTDRWTTSRRRRSRSRSRPSSSARSTWLGAESKRSDATAEAATSSSSPRWPRCSRGRSTCRTRRPTPASSKRRARCGWNWKAPASA